MAETIVGLLVIGAGALALIACSFWCITRCYLHLLNSRYDDAKTAAMNQIAGRLHNDGDWFSEDPPTYKLLQRLAKGMTTHGWNDASSVRDEWREWRKSGSVNQNEKAVR